MSYTNGTSQSQPGNVLRICQLNVEGLSRNKGEILSKILRENKVDVIALQETHTEDDNALWKRGRIPGYKLVSRINHPQYGVASFVRNNLKDVSVILEEKSDEGNVMVAVIQIGNIKVANIYKPPNTIWHKQLPVLEHPAIYVGDFNSHSHEWGYAEEDENGRILA